MEMITIHTDEGIRTAIVLGEGPKYVRMIWADDRRPGVRVNKVPKDRMRRDTKPLMYKGKPYPLARAKRHFRNMGRALGITKSARKELRA